MLSDTTEQNDGGSEFTKEAIFSIQAFLQLSHVRL